MEEFQKTNQAAFNYRLIKNLLAGLVLSLFVSLFAVMAQTNVLIIIVCFLLPLIAGYIFASVEYQNLGYKIEANSIGFRQGIFSLKTLTFPFIKITNASFNQSFIQRLFSVGDIVVDQEDAENKLKGIDKETADKIIQEIASKSNIQPITK